MKEKEVKMERIWERKKDVKGNSKKGEGNYLNCIHVVYAVRLLTCI